MRVCLFRHSRATVGARWNPTCTPLSRLLAAVYWRRRYPVFAFAILWFFLTLAPTSSFMPIQDVIFEHRLYLLAVGDGAPSRRLGQRRQRHRWGGRAGHDRA